MREEREADPASIWAQTLRLLSPWSQDSKLLATGLMNPQDHKKLLEELRASHPEETTLERDLINILWNRYLHMINPFYALYPCFHTFFPPSHYLDPSLSPALAIINPIPSQNAFPLHPVVSPYTPRQQPPQSQRCSSTDSSWCISHLNCGNEGFLGQALGRGSGRVSHSLSP